MSHEAKIQYSLKQILLFNNFKNIDFFPDKIKYVYLFTDLTPRESQQLPLAIQHLNSFSFFLQPFSLRMSFGGEVLSMKLLESVLNTRDILICARQVMNKIRHRISSIRNRVFARGGFRGGAAGPSPPPDRFREGRSPPPEISRQKMFPI